MANTLVKSTKRLCMAVAFTAFAASCSGTAEMKIPPDAVCRAIVNEKCVKCHYKTRICDALGTKSRGDWHKTIKFMQRQGARLNADEYDKVVACLSSQPKGSDVVCE